MTKGFGILLLVLASVTPALADDAAADFSVASNPNGVWTYYGAGEVLPDSSANCYGVVGVACWNNGNPGIPNNASISVNNTGSPIAYNGTVTLASGQFDLDPEATGSVIVAWTAPSTGNYSVSGYFSGLDTTGNPHPAEVFVAGSMTDLFSYTIDTGKTYDFSFVLAATAGEVLDFEVDTGDTNGYYLGTGFNVDIDPTGVTPEPSSLSLFVLGLVGLAAWGYFATRRSTADSPTQI